MTITDTRPLVVSAPDELDFEGADFLEDQTLAVLLADVVRSYPRLSLIHTYGISIKVLWKRRGGKSQGNSVFAKCVKTSGLVKHFGDTDFVIWLAADHLAASDYTTAQIRKLLYHECRHVAWQGPDPDKEDDEGKPIIVGHDVELFLGEIVDTGAWEDFRRALAGDFAQPELFADSAAEGDEP